MSRRNSSGKEVSIDEECYSDPGADTQERLVPSSDRMTKAKVDANAPDSTLTYQGLTLKQEEKARARDREIARTRWARSFDDREERTRAVVTDADVGAPHGTPLDELTPAVPLAGLASETQEAAARKAAEMADELDTRWSALTLQEELGTRLRAGDSLGAAVLTVAEEAERHPALGAQGDIAIEAVERTDSTRVTVTGQVDQRWEPQEGSGIEWVGLVADDTDRVKVTVWESACISGLTRTYSEPGWPRWREPALRGALREHDEVIIRNAKRTWHNGRANLEVDRHADIEITERPSRSSGSDD